MQIYYSYETFNQTYYPNTHIKTLVNKFWFKDFLDRYTFTLTINKQKSDEFRRCNFNRT